MSEAAETSSSVDQPDRPVGQLRLSGWKVFAFILGIYLLLMAGHTYSPDEETLLATSVSLFKHGTFALPRNSTQVQVPGVDGQLYSQYGPGQPVAALPVVAVGIAVGDWVLNLDRDGEAFTLRIVAGLFNPLIAALLCALFWSALLLLGVGPRFALALTLILGFATYLWPHSRTFFGEPLTALLLFLAFYFLLRAKSIFASPHLEARATRALVVYGLIAGFAMAAAVATKAQYVVALPALGLYGLWVAFVAGRTPEVRQQRNTPRTKLGIRLLASLLVGGAVGLGLLMLYNLSVFGGPLATGYGSDLAGTFKTPLYEGLFGLLFSSGKGLWLYAPPVFLAVAGWSAFFRRYRVETWLIVLVALPVATLFALYRFWPGDGAWGPRYLIPILPFLLLPAAGLAFRAEQVEERRWLRGPRLAVLVFGSLGLVVSFLGAAVNFDTYINVVNDDATRYWYPEASPARGHWVLLGQRADEWRCRLLPCDGAQLVSGFSYSEGDKFLGDLFPRWTNGHAVVRLPAEPVTVVMRLADHRPPPLPRAEVTLSAEGGQITSQQRVPVPDSPVSSILTATVEPAAPGDRPLLALDIPTWNPKEVAGSSRDENLGLMVEKLTVEDRDGRPLAIREALPVAAMYPAPRWYYDPASHHPLDWWGWYLYAAGLPRRAGLVALLIVIPAIVALAWSIRVVLRQLAGRI